MRKLISVLIVLYWLGMMAWLVGDQFSRKSEINYKTALKTVEEPKRSQMNIYDKKGKKIGRVRRAVLPQPDLSYRQISRLELSRNPIASFLPGALEMNNVVTVDKNYQVADILITIWHGRTKWLTLNGRPSEKGFNLYVDRKLFRTIPSVDVNNLIGTNFSALDQLPQLSEGKKWNMNIVSPINILSGDSASKFDVVSARVGKLTTLKIDGKAVKVYPVTIDAPWQPITAFVTPQGEVLEETSLFYTLKKASFEYDDWME